jgi:DNA polymerase-4
VLDLNRETAQIMHIDLNSAFATLEQQAHVTLRGLPVGVTNRKVTNYSCVIACSYEAKAKGVKVGMRLGDAKVLCPNMIMLESDPPKYHHAYKKLVAIMQDYSPNIQMLSIDEGIIDFHGTLGTIHKRPLVDIGMEIKERVRREIGDWVRINVGIGPNRFWAKQAAGLHKPDGLDQVNHKNLVNVLKSLQLTDLTGIASHFEARLNAAGIYTTMDFLQAKPEYLRRRVFNSVCGLDWHQRIRGHEVDGNPTKLGHIGRQFVMDKPSNDDDTLLTRFHYLCETTGKKLRYNNRNARGVLVWLHFQTGDSWYIRKMFHSSFFSDMELYRRALLIFNQRPKHMIVQAMGVTCYGIEPSNRAQISLMDSVNKEEWLTEAIDEINERYGSFVIHSADTLEGKRVVKQKIPFGGTRYFELLLKHE